MSDTTKGAAKDRTRGSFGDVAKTYAAPAPAETSATAKPPEVERSGPRVRASQSTTTSGGLLRRSCYFHPEEWRAVLVEAERRDTTAAAVVRAAVREALGLGSDEGNE